ncbi:cysteine--tRNA ligase [Chloroflexota bacterium]
MKVYNTLSGQKEEFSPQDDEVKMYVCGVTPYDDSHIGHAMSYIGFDVIRRYLQFKGYRVKYVQNITDIEDKLIDRANRLGVPVSELAEKFTASYFADMDALNISRADIYPRATEEIPKIIEVIQGLIDKGHAYAAAGSVYFRVKSIADYGKLSHRNPESMMAAEGAVGSEEKESPMDFALWKAEKLGEPSWQSPWGEGRPGWHIECSAISMKYLGATIDIHGGGQDLIFPHHENEMTQSESFTGEKPFVRYWLHNGMVQLGEEKMSKSLGNLVTIKDVLSRYSADAIRIFSLGSHYRSPLTYSEEALEAAEKGAERLRQAAHGKEGKSDGGMDAGPYREKFVEAMDDDFNAAQALAVIFDLAREINRGDDEGLQVGEAREALKELAGVLGLIFEAAERSPLAAEPFVALRKSTIAAVREAKPDELLDESEIVDAPAIIDWLIDMRVTLRKDKIFQLADEIRAKLSEAGIALEDSPQGTIWKRKR